MLLNRTVHSCCFWLLLLNLKTACIAASISSMIVHIFLALTQKDNVCILNPTCKRSDWLGCQSGKQQSTCTTRALFNHWGVGWHSAPCHLRALFEEKAQQFGLEKMLTFSFGFYSRRSCAPVKTQAAPSVIPGAAPALRHRTNTTTTGRGR